MLVPETTFVIVFVPPAPKLPTPDVANILAPTFKPVVEAMPVIVTVHGPVPVGALRVPLALISLPTVVLLFAFQFILVPEQPFKISPPFGFVNVIA
jgi:hypothetical protein